MKILGVVKVWAQMSPMSDGQEPVSLAHETVYSEWVYGRGTELKSITAGKDIIKGPHI